MAFSRTIRILVPSVFALGMVGVALPAQVASGSASVVNGTCSKGSLSNLQVQREDNGTLSIDFGIDMSRHTSNVVWTVKVTDNGTVVSRGKAKTIADGSFSVSKAITPKIGTNHIVANASNVATGETCTIRTVA